MQYRYELTSDAFAVDRDGYLVVARADLDRDPPSPGQLTFQVTARLLRSGGKSGSRKMSWETVGLAFW